MIKQHAFTERNDHLEQAYSIDLNKKFQGQTLDAIRWILFYSDGKTSLEKISEITNFPVDFLVNISHQLEKVDLIELIS
jgi:aminopeptidase-like protein